MKTNIFYNNETIASLDPGQSATLLCDGQRMKSNLQVETETLVFGKILQSTGDSETDTMSQKVITQEFENTFSKINQLESGCVIKEQASGSIVALTDSANAPIESLTIYGKTTQAVEPTPEAPQELISVGADGDIKVNILGKNLWRDASEYLLIGDGTNASIAVVDVQSLTGKITLSCDALITNVEYSQSGNLIAYQTKYRDDETYKAFVSSANVQSGKIKYTINADEYGGLKQIIIRKYSRWTGGTIKLTNFQLEAGEVATEYEPYQEPQVMTIPTPIALNGIPIVGHSFSSFTDTAPSFTDYNGTPFIADYIDLERGVKVQNIWKQVLNGSESSWETRTSYYNDTSSCYILWDSELEKTKKKGMDNIISSHFENLQLELGNWSNSNIEPSICGYNSATKYAFFIRINNSTIGATSNDSNTNVALFKEWLANNPVTILYELAEPIETPLTEAEMVAYQEYYTNYPNTTIYSDDGAFLNIKYKADTKQYIDNKFNSLEKAILSLGGNV